MPPDSAEETKTGQLLLVKNNSSWRDHGYHVYYRRVGGVSQRIEILYLSDNICQTIDNRGIIDYTRSSLVRQLDFSPMSTLLIKHATILVTMDDHRREIPDGGLFIRDGFIEKVGLTGEMPSKADEVLDLSGHLVLPGLVNTHHHFYQTLTRAVPAAQDANLFNWLKTLYPIWARMTPDDIFISTQTALAELALSGCTTASDHLYLFPNGSRLDDEIAAAREIGVRIQAARGSMSLGESKGGLPPDSVVDTEANILRDSQRLIETYHDPKPGAFVQIVLAPCSPFSVTGELMKQSAKLAREYGGAPAHASGRDRGRASVLPAEIWLPARGIHAVRGLGRAGCLVCPCGLCGQ